MKTLLVRTHMVAMIAMLGGGVAAAQAQTMTGYVVDSTNTLVMDGYGNCIRTGSWTPDLAIVECDPDLVKTAQTPPPVERPVAPAPRAAPAPAPAPVPAPVLLSIESDTLFAFDSAVIRAEGKRDLDRQVVRVMRQQPRIEMITITGYTDRIGSSTYNMKLSQQRADAVRAYLIEQGVSAGRIETKGMGSANPVVSCDTVRGEVSGRNKALVDCLRPNRRVEVEIKTQR